LDRCTNFNKNLKAKNWGGYTVYGTNLWIGKFFFTPKAGCQLVLFKLSDWLAVLRLFPCQFVVGKVALAFQLHALGKSK
jgi:hypothetical protein